MEVDDEKSKNAVEAVASKLVIPEMKKAGDLAVPSDAKEVINNLDYMTYGDRVKYSVKIGQSYKGNEKKVDEIIKELRATPPPQAPEMETDEGLMEILKPQERDVGKNYPRHQVALLAATVSNNHTDILKEEIESQSKMFKQFVISNYVKQEKDDNKIVELVENSAPATQKKIIHGLVKAGRKSCLDILADKMRIIAGIDFMVDFVHGCSSEKLKECMGFNAVKYHKRLRWDKIMKFHQQMIIDMMREELKEAMKNDYEYNSIFNQWTRKDKDSIKKSSKRSAWDEFLQTGTTQSGKIWELVLEFPHCQTCRDLDSTSRAALNKEVANNDGEYKTYKDARLHIILPDIVKNKFHYFTRRNPDKFLQWVDETTVKTVSRHRLRTSIPGRFWCNREFDYKTVFEILELIKKKSFDMIGNHSLLPYHKLWKGDHEYYVKHKKHLTTPYVSSISTLYTSSSNDSSLAQFHYGKKLREFLGYDYLLLCEITRNRHKYSLFASFSPYMITKLINWAFDWFTKIEPKGTEHHLYDYMGWMEMQYEWIHTWLTRLHLKRNVKTGENRYDSCIELLINTWTKLWDKLMSCQWRERAQERLQPLESLEYRLHHIKKWYEVKCKHETRNHPSSEESSLASAIDDYKKGFLGSSNNKTLYEYCGLGSSYVGIENIQRLVKEVNHWETQFTKYAQSIRINTNMKGKTMYSRQWPLKNAINSLHNRIKTMLRLEQSAIKNWDWWVSFHAMRNIRKVRRSEKFKFLEKLYEYLWAHRPVYYFYNNKSLSILNANGKDLKTFNRNSDNYFWTSKRKYEKGKVTSDRKSMFESWMSKWRSMYRDIGFEMLHTSMCNKKTFTNKDYGWNLAKQSMFKVVDSYKYELSMKCSVNLNEEFNKWTSSTTYKQKYDIFRCGGVNTKFNRRTFVIPSLSNTLMKYICDRRSVGKSKKKSSSENESKDDSESKNETDDGIIGVDLLNDLYETYFDILDQIRPPTRHTAFESWKKIYDENVRSLLRRLLTFYQNTFESIQNWARDEIKDPKGEKYLTDDDKLDRKLTQESLELSKKWIDQLFEKLYTLYSGYFRVHWDDDHEMLEQYRNLVYSWNSHVSSIRVSTRDAVRSLNSTDYSHKFQLNLLIDSINSNDTSDLSGHNIIRIGEALCEAVEYFSNAGSGDFKNDGNESDDSDTDITVNANVKKENEMTDEREKRFKKRLARLANVKHTQFPKMHVDNCQLLKRIYDKMVTVYNRFENNRMGRDRKALGNVANICSYTYKYLYDPHLFSVIDKFLPVFSQTQTWHEIALKLARNSDPWRTVHFDTFDTVIDHLCHVIKRLENGKKVLIEKNEKKKAIAAMEGSVQESDKKEKENDTVMTGQSGSGSDDTIPGEYATVDEYDNEITKVNDTISKYMIQAFDFEFEYFELATHLRNDTIANYIVEIGKEYQKKYGKKEATRAQLMIEIESKLTKGVFDLDGFDQTNVSRLLKLFALLQNAPSSDFVELFNKIKELIIEQLQDESRSSSFLQALMRALKSKKRCEAMDNWMVLWEVLVEIRGGLETKFDSLCCDLLIHDNVEPEQRFIIFEELCKNDHLTFLSQKYNDLFIRLFGAVLDFPDRCTDATRKLANEHLNYFLDEKAKRIIPDTMDQLLRYLDIRDHKVRNRLKKLADSNSVDQREAALRHMISATLLCKKEDLNTQVKRTIDFFANKLKNEAIDRREVGLEILFGELKSQNDLILASDECLRYLMEMLQDCLEVQDLDKNEDNKEWENIHEHRILRHFLQLSVDAMEYAVRLFKDGNQRSDLNEKLFDFGFELQWRMCVFRKGSKESCEQFRVNLGSIVKRSTEVEKYKKLLKESNNNEEFVLSKMDFDKNRDFYFVPRYESQFVKMLFDCYEKRIVKNNPNYLTDSLMATQYLLPLFDILGSNWKDCQLLKDLLNNLVQEFEKLEFELDFEGIMIKCTNDISKDMNDEIKELLNKELQRALSKVLDAILLHSKEEWYDLSVIEEFVKALFKGLRILHEHGNDFILEECQIILTKMLDYILEKACKNERSKKEYKDDWKDQSICKLIIESCLQMLSCENYPRKHSGRFWSMQWEIHKVFRMRMMNVDKENLKKRSITKLDNPQEDLYAFKWTLFNSYWQCNLDNLRYAMNIKESRYKKKHAAKKMNDLTDKVSKMAIDDNVDDGKSDTSDDGDAMRVRRDKDRETVPTFFNNEEERECYKYEAAVWCIDLACQWIWGGNWFTAIECPARLLLESSDPSDPLAFMIVPTLKTFDTRSKSVLKHRWHEVPMIVSILEQVVRSLDMIKYYKCDMEGLRVIESNHPSLLLMEKLIKNYHYNRSKVIKMKTKFSDYWFNIPLLSEYNDIIMHSRQIRCVLWRWWYYRSSTTPASTERTEYTRAVSWQKRCKRKKARKIKKRKEKETKAAEAKKKAEEARRTRALRGRRRGRRGGRSSRPTATRAALKKETANTAAAASKGHTIAEKNKIIRGKTNKDKPTQLIANKGNAIRELLSITKSAIYLRFVWSYLAQHDQLLLTQFIEEGSPFRGVFYRSPDRRKYTRRQMRERKYREKYMLDRYDESDEKTSPTGRKLGASGAMKKEELNKKSAKRGGGKEATRRMLGVTAAKRAEDKEKTEPLTIEEQVDKERKEQEEFEAAFEEWKLENAGENDNDNDNGNENKNDDDSFDHRDIWIFEGCYQLQKLLPNQLEKIGQRDLLAAMNENRGMPERVKSIIRWTLLPTTSYKDIVDFFNDHKKLPINLIEALLKGVMENDEVLAPMNYLLQPKFLKSQQARVAAFAIAKCVPHVHRRQYTKLLRSILSGERRNALKVTAYKQIMRMLIAVPSKTHIRMIVHEWDRDELHRDVRIVILRAALGWLRADKPVNFCVDAAWHILETAVTNPNIRSNIEIMTAIMGVTISGGASLAENYYKGLVLEPNIIEHLNTFKELPIPNKHCKRFAKIIVILCDRVYTQYVDPNAIEAEAKDESEAKAEMKEEEDTDMNKAKDGSSDSSDSSDSSTSKEDDDDAKIDREGPYIVNAGKPRCDDDIAFIAMKSLTLWTRYNEHTVKPAVRVLAETICDFSGNFVANFNTGTQEVNDKRFEMACQTLKEVISFRSLYYSKNRIPFVTSIREIFEQFDNIICETKLSDLRDILKLTPDQKKDVSLTDENATARMYLRKVERRFQKFVEELGSFSAVPIDHYYRLFMPLEHGNSRGMYVSTIMPHRMEMLQSSHNMTDDKGYIDYLLSFMQDAMYYGCCDLEYGYKSAFTHITQIFDSIQSSKRYSSKETQAKLDRYTVEIIRRFVTNALPKQTGQDVDVQSGGGAQGQAQGGDYDESVLQSDSYEHLRQRIVSYFFDRLKFGKSHYGTGNDGGSMMKQVCPLMLQFFVARIELLIASIANGSATESVSSLWNKSCLDKNGITSQITAWIALGIKWYPVQTHAKTTANLLHHEHGRKYFDTIINKCMEIMKKPDNERLSVADWVWLNLFCKLFNDSPKHIVVLYHNMLDKLIKLICNMDGRTVINDMENPFKKYTMYNLSNFVSKVWDQMSHSIFLKSYSARQSEFVAMILDWYFEIGNQQKAREKLRLQQQQKQKGSKKQQKQKSIFGSLRDAIMGLGTKEKSTAYDAQWNQEIVTVCTMFVSQSKYCSVAWPLVKNKIVNFYETARIAMIEEEEYKFTQELAKAHFDQLKEEASIATYSKGGSSSGSNDDGAVRTGNADDDMKGRDSQQKRAGSPGSSIDLAALAISDAKCDKLDKNIMGTSARCFSWLSQLFTHVAGKLSVESHRDERSYTSHLLRLLLKRASGKDDALQRQEPLHYESMVAYHQRLMFNLLTQRSRYLTFVLSKQLQECLDLMIDMCVNPIKDGKTSATWDNVVSLIDSIITQLCPQWSYNKKRVTGQAKKIVTDLFRKYINVPLKNRPLSELNKEETVTRNVCLRLLNGKNQLVCAVFDHEIANVLKYTIDMVGWHKKMTFKDTTKVYYNYSGFSLSSVVNRCFDNLNPPNYLGRRSVEPITKALFAKFWKTIDTGNAALREGKELPISYDVCCDLIWYFMSNKPEMLTQALLDETLVKIFLWSVKYAANGGYTVNNIVTYMKRLTKYLSPLFANGTTSRSCKMHNIALKIFEELLNHCVDLGNSGNVERIKYDKVCNYCYKILLQFTNSNDSLKYIIVTALNLNSNQVNILSDIIYCLTVRRCLMQTTFTTDVDNHIFKIIGKVDSIAKQWKIDESDESDQKTQKNVLPPAKRRRKAKGKSNDNDAVTTSGKGSKNEMEVDDGDDDSMDENKYEIDELLEDQYTNLSQQALTLIGRIFAKDFRHELRKDHFPMTESQNAMWNDYMVRLSVKLMSNSNSNVPSISSHRLCWYILQTRNLHKCGKWFLASWIKYVSNVPLRLKDSNNGTDDQFLKYFTQSSTYLSCFDANTEGTPEEIELLKRRQVLTWLYWLTSACVVDGDEARQLGFTKQHCYHLAKLTIKLIIYFGHHSCVKVSVIKEEIEAAKEAKENEDGDNDNDDDTGMKEKDDDVTIVSKGKEKAKGKGKGKGKETKGGKGKKGRKKQGTSDESVMWRSEYVTLLNRFADYPSPFVRLLVKKVETVFDDFNTQTTVWSNELNSVVFG